MEKPPRRSKTGKDRNRILSEDGDEDVKKPERNVMQLVELNVDSIASEIVFEIRKQLEEFTDAAASQRYPPRYTKSTNLDYRGSDTFKMPNRISGRRPSDGLDSSFERVTALSQGKDATAQLPEMNLSALSTSFRVVRRILLSVAELLQQFSNKLNRAAVTAENETSELESQWPRIEPEMTETGRKSVETADPQYNQYVYQIAFYLLEILGEQLSNFGAMMNFSSSHLPANMKWRRASLFEPLPEECWLADSAESTDAIEPETSIPKLKASDKMRLFGRESLRKGRKISDGIKQSIADALEIVCDVFSNVFDYLTDDTSRPSSRGESLDSGRDKETSLSSGKTSTLSSEEAKTPDERTRIRGSRGDAISAIRNPLVSINEGLFGTPGDRFYPESASTASSSFFGKRNEDVKLPATDFLCGSCRRERGVKRRKRAQSCPVQEGTTIKDFIRQRAHSCDISPKIKAACGNISGPLSGEETEEASEPGHSQGVPIREMPVKSTQTSSEYQPGRLSVTDKASLSEIAHDCANRIIDDLIQMAIIVSLGDENPSSVRCTACDAVIYIDLSDDSISDSGLTVPPDLDDLIYNPGETSDPKCPCKGFYMLPETKPQPESIRYSRTEELCSETDAAVINVLSLDLNEFTNSLRRKFHEVLRSRENANESSPEECLDSSFVNEKAILSILLECCRQASQMLKEPGSTLQDESLYITNGGPGKTSPLGEICREESSGDDNADRLNGTTQGTLDDETATDAMVSEKKRRDRRELGKESLERKYFRERKSEEVSRPHVHTSTSPPGYHHRVRFESDVKDSDGPSLSRSHGEHLEDVGFHFSEIDSDLSYLWDECDKYATDLVEPHPHVIIHHEAEFPPNALEVREMVNGRIIRRLEEWEEDADNIRRGTFWRFQDGGNVENSGVSLHHAPEQLYVSVRHPGDEKAEGSLKTARGEHALPEASILRNTGLAYMKPPLKPESEDQSFCQSNATSSWPGNYPFTAADAKRRSCIRAPSGEWNLLCKIWQFLDERKKDGFGRGPPLHLVLHRHRAVEEAFDALFLPSAFPLHYYRELRVTFKDRQDREERRDCCQELFSLLSHQLFSKYHYGLFDHPSANSLTLYLNPDSDAEAHWFQFAGVILALSLLHQKQMGISLPISFFKCMLDRPFTINDIEEVDPDLYETLNWLKQNKVSNMSSPLAFVINDKYGDGTYKFELIPDGSSVYVTDANKIGYIEKAIKWKLAERCFCQMKEFRRGFLSILEPHMLFIFTSDELQYLIARTPEEGPLEDSMNTPVRRCTW